MTLSDTLATPPAPSPATPRRGVLRAGLGITAGAAATAGVLGGAARADAAATAYKPGHYRGAPLLSGTAHHLVTRFSYGVTPALTAAVRRAGSAGRWFDAQLEPQQVADPEADAVTSWWPSLRYSPTQLWQREREGTESGWQVMADYQRWLLVRRVRTNRPVLEVMTEFWMNHFHVPVHDDGVYTHRFDYDRVVRAHALGRFDDLLEAAITHPAMGMYLDNAVSTREHPNENLGRELLELHTVGRIYSEDDVKSSARILTGFSVDMWRTFVASYVAGDHWTGAVKVLGFSHPNTAADGRAVVTAYLRYLARHPRTAERIARKLAVKFVSDTPSDALVARLTKVYLDNDTEIAPVLRALVASTEFGAAVGAKVRDPAEDVVASYRALGVTLRQVPAGDSDYAVDAMLWQCSSLGATPHDWPRPDGAPIDSVSWSSPARLLASMDVHWSLAGGWWPKQGLSYRAPRNWLPRPRVRFDVLVDHVSQQMLGKRSTAGLLQACCVSTDCRPSTIITADHALVKWGFHRLLSTVLDSPSHLTR